MTKFEKILADAEKLEKCDELAALLNTIAVELMCVVKKKLEESDLEERDEVSKHLDKALDALHDAMERLELRRESVNKDIGDIDDPYPL